MANLPARFGLSRYEADEHYKIAISFYQKHNLEQALLHLGHALALLPYNSEYLAAQGFFFLEDGIADKAEAAFDQALKMNAYELLANYGKGVLAYREKDWQKATMYFLNAWAAAPERAETLYYLALASHHSGDNRKALEAKKPTRDAARWVTELERIVAKS
jgi:Flp pilus assembly protein TadD